MINMKMFLGLILLLFIFRNIHGQNPFSNKLFSTKELLEDILFVKNNLEKKDPNLFVFANKRSVDSLFNALSQSITKPITSREFYNLLCAMQSCIKDGHNYFLPSKSEQEFNLKNSKYFPLNFIVFKSKLIVTQNFSNDSSIHAGDEIVTINNQKAIDVFNYLVNHQVRDGNNLNYPKWISQNYFRSYYGFLFGFPDTYQLEIQKTSRIEKIAISALPLPIIKQRRKESKNQPYDRIDYEKAIYWELNKEKKYAVLTIKNWKNSILKSDFNQNFKQEIDKFFKKIKQEGVQKIILDIRGNQGGDSWNSIYFLKHILKYKFSFYISVSRYNNKHKLKKCNKSLSKIYQPFENNYNGKITLLIDGGSFSNSSMFASFFKNNKLGNIYGSETGGSKHIVSGNSGFINLPNTKIQMLNISRQMLMDAEKIEIGEGVKPDVEISPNLQNIIENKDVVLQFAIEN